MRDGRTLPIPSACTRIDYEGSEMTPTEYKALEGNKIQPMLGALAAVASGGLFSFGASSAPFFLLAALAVPVSYVFWLGVDNYFLMQLEAKTAGLENKLPELREATIGCQSFMLTYFIVSIGSISIGFYAHFGTYKAPINVDCGFLIVGIIALLGVAHATGSILKRRSVRLSLVESLSSLATPTPES